MDDIATIPRRQPTNHHGARPVETLHPGGVTLRPGGGTLRPGGGTVRCRYRRTVIYQSTRVATTRCTRTIPPKTGSSTKPIGLHYPYDHRRSDATGKHPPTQNPGEMFGRHFQNATAMPRSIHLLCTAKELHDAYVHSKHRSDA